MKLLQKIIHFGYLYSRYQILSTAFWIAEIMGCILICFAIPLALMYALLFGALYLFNLTIDEGVHFVTNGIYDIVTFCDVCSPEHTWINPLTVSTSLLIVASVYAKEIYQRAFKPTFYVLCEYQERILHALGIDILYGWLWDNDGKWNYIYSNEEKEFLAKIPTKPLIVFILIALTMLGILIYRTSFC